MKVDSVHADARHRFSKPALLQVRLMEGVGVEGDAHAGATVQHVHLKKKEPSAPNLRQVHLIQRELFAELADAGYDVGPGDLGENVTTEGLDLFTLPTGTRLHLGESAVVTVTGLRSPCQQIDKFRKGLLKQVLRKADDGSVVRRVGVMGVVTATGWVRPGDPLEVRFPAEPHRPLDLV